jgi:hypothetical protein
MSSSDLSNLRRWHEGLSQLWGSGMPQPMGAPRPPIPTFKPDPPIPELKPRSDDGEDEEGWLTSLGRKLWRALDDFMQEPSGGPTETPPLDPPFPPPPAIPTIRRPGRGFRVR